MKSFFLISLITFSFSLSAWAETNLSETQRQLGEMVCSPWSTIKESYVFRSVSEETSVQTSHQRVRAYLERAPKIIEQAMATYKQALADNNRSLAAQSRERAILACAFMEDSTLNFELSCLDNEGAEILSEEIIQTCLSLHK